MTDDFNINAFFKNQYLNEVGLGNSKAQLLANSINKAMVEIDDSMSYKDFAVAVSIILKDEYGSHNFSPFMEVLHAGLGMKESINEYGEFENQENKLSKEIDDIFGGNPYVSMGVYARTKGEGYGKVSFRMRDEFADDKWNEILNFVKSKGYNITQESNYYDIEPGEREWFPTIDFKFNSTNI